MRGTHVSSGRLIGQAAAVGALHLRVSVSKRPKRTEVLLKTSPQPSSQFEKPVANPGFVLMWFPTSPTKVQTPIACLRHGVVPLNRRRPRRPIEVMAQAPGRHLRQILIASVKPIMVHPINNIAMASPSNRVLVKDSGCRRRS